jgi:DNA-binding LacI/PurR family transcriptional regulator
MGRRDISNDLAQRISVRIGAGEWKPGQFLPPERELADSLDVSRLTLRKALALLHERGMVERRRGRGTCVTAGTPAHPGTGAGIMWMGQHAAHTYTDLFFAINQVASARGLTVSVLSDSNANAWTPRTTQGSANNLVCTASRLPDALALPRDPAGVLVCLDILAEQNSQADVSIWGDRPGALALATRSLIELGHRRIAYVGRASDGRTGQPGNPGARLYGAYLEELRLHDLGWNRLIDGSLDGQTESVMDANIARQLADASGRPTACVCDLDWRALSVLRAAASLGLTVPRDLSVVGLGDTPWTEAVRPTLTSVAFDITGMAQSAIDAVIAGRPAVPRTIMVAGRLSARGTTAPPPT